MQLRITFVVSYAGQYTKLFQLCYMPIKYFPILTHYTFKQCYILNEFYYSNDCCGPKQLFSKLKKILPLDSKDNFTCRKNYPFLGQAQLKDDHQRAMWQINRTTSEISKKDYRFVSYTYTSVSKVKELHLVHKLMVCICYFI